MLTEFFGNYPRIRVIELLISNPYMEYTKKDMAESASISRNTLYDFFKKLEEYNLIKPAKKYGNTQLFKVNSESPIIKAISSFQMQLAQIEINKQMDIYNEQKEPEEEFDLNDIFNEIDRIIDEEQEIRKIRWINHNKASSLLMPNKFSVSKAQINPIKINENKKTSYFNVQDNKSDNLSIMVPKSNKIKIGAI